MFVNVCDICENVGCIVDDSDGIRIFWSDYIRVLVLKNSWLIRKRKIDRFLVSFM